MARRHRVGPSRSWGDRPSGRPVDQLDPSVIQLSTHGGPGTSEEVIKDSNLMTEKHQSINQVRSHETGTTSD
jgi:hypothetical protein